jgi:hypothetical protein
MGKRQRKHHPEERLTVQEDPNFYKKNNSKRKTGFLFNIDQFTFAQV